jgi:cyclohexyl-isocyanide hydratase
MLTIGAIIFDDIDQLDFTGPFEVLTRLPDATFHVIGRTLQPVRDVRGLILTPDTTISNAPPLDILVIPGGPGQQALMSDEPMLAFVRERAARASIVLSVCTGALIAGAADLLQSRKATTHWAAQSLLGYFGATVVDERVVVDGNLVTTAGVTSGIDGALRVAAMVCGDAIAQRIQLSMEYAPAPPFDAGSPGTAPEAVVATARESLRAINEARLETAKHYAAKQS